MSKKNIEQKLEELEDFLREFYADQLMKTNHKMTYAMHRKITSILKDIYKQLDSMKED